MNELSISRSILDPELRQSLIQYVYGVIGCMQYVHRQLGPAMPEYIYQEALCRKLIKEQFDVRRELIYHPSFDGASLESYIKMDMVVMLPHGNVIIECKSIKSITDREQFQTFGYLRGTSFPIAILVNFGTWPKAQIERYYYHDGIIRAF
jgi:GxxExxY protein